jgi:hypothetical protein
VLAIALANKLARIGRFSTRGAPSRASRPMQWRPDPRNPDAVARPGRDEGTATARTKEQRKMRSY